MERKILVTRSNGQKQNFTAYFDGYPKKDVDFIVDNTGIAESIGSAEYLGINPVRRSEKCNECRYQANCNLTVKVDHSARFAKVRGTCFKIKKNQSFLYPMNEGGYFPVNFSKSRTPEERLNIITCPNFGVIAEKLIEEKKWQSKRCQRCGILVSHLTPSMPLDVRGMCKAEKKL